MLINRIANSPWIHAATSKYLAALLARRTVHSKIDTAKYFFFARI
jgi:hypothetical protein